MTRRLNKEMENQHIKELKSEVDRLNRRIHTLQTHLEAYRGAFEGAIKGLGRMEDK